MSNIVYITGAGFSAPLEIPVMRDFIIRSKDIHLSDPKKYAHFQEIFDTLRDLSVIKNYYHSNLHNIEEVLSILEMQDFLGKGDRAKTFKRFIADVVTSCTPDMPTLNQRPNLHNLNPDLFGDLWTGYGFFVCALLGIKFEPTTPGVYLSKVDSHNYSIVTLNYDIVVEKISDHINKYCGASNRNVHISCDEKDVKPSGMVAEIDVAKLHGSVDKLESIISPTWNKSSAANLATTWGRAFEMLREANHVRFLGYSLPLTDAYVRYLLKSAMLRSPHLKSIDVICRDPDGDVQKRYNEFVDFDYYRFSNADIGHYLHGFARSAFSQRVGDLLEFSGLDSHHETFMSRF